MKRMVKRALAPVVRSSFGNRIVAGLNSIAAEGTPEAQAPGPGWSLSDFEQPLRINLGCGDDLKPGWANVDLFPPANIVHDVRQGLPFPGESAAVIYSEHFLEHLEYPGESVPVLDDCFRVLQPGGVLHVGVPDSRLVVEAGMKDPIDPAFLAEAEANDWGYPDHCQTGFEYINHHFRLDGFHKFAFDEATLKAQLERRGFIDVERRPFDPNLDTEKRQAGTMYVTARKPQA